MYRPENINRPLGSPIPFGDPHAVSVNMREWQNVIGYEEKDPEVLAKLQSGYPRFRLHPYYEALRERFGNAKESNEAIWVLPSLHVAGMCVDFVRAGRVQETDAGVALAIVPRSDDAKAKAFWQHAGLIVSSRQAENILAGKAPSIPDSTRQELKKLVAEPYGADTGDVSLYPTGMAAIFAGYQAAVCSRGKKTIQLGFPYVDTLKIQQNFGGVDGECIHISYNTPDYLKVLEAHARQGDIAAVFVEVPDNPLLRTPDLQEVHKILKKYGVPLIVDNTLGTPFNIDVQPYADLTATSLTKFFSGEGNVMGGSMILNPQSPHYSAFKSVLNAGEELLYPDDAAVLLKNGKGFAARMEAINRNAEQLFEFLRHHPAIDQVFYPKGDKAYDAIRTKGGGYGGLLSFTLKNETRAPAVYDALEIAKGPGLGTNFTLACPYTLLGHFTEQEWARQNGVSPYLIRVSVGDEPDLVPRFTRALAASRLAA